MNLHSLMIPSCCGWGYAFFLWKISGQVFWPYFAGAATLAIGLVRLPQDEIRRAEGLDKLIWFGPLMVAIAMAIFGADHFMFSKFVAMIVPKWVHWRLFCTYFVGVALLASALSLATTVRWRLAATMLGTMLLLFVVLLHTPNLIHFPKQRAIVRTLFLRDLALGAGIFAFGISLRAIPKRGVDGGGVRLGLITMARFLMAVPIAIFGIQNLRNPTLAPGFPQDDPMVVITLPSWIPAHAVWAYVAGAIFIGCGIGLMIRRYAHAAAMTLAVTVLVLQLIAYIPQTIARASDVTTGLNYLAIYFALAGALLMLAGAVGEKASGIGC